MDDKTNPSRIERDPESADALLSGRAGLSRPGVDAGEGPDPAAEELKEAGLGPVGVAAVDVVATEPAAQPLPARWALTDAEIRPIILGVCLSMFDGICKPRLRMRRRDVR